MFAFLTPNGITIFAILQLVFTDFVFVHFNPFFVFASPALACGHFVTDVGIQLLDCRTLERLSLITQPLLSLQALTSWIVLIGFYPSSLSRIASHDLALGSLSIQTRPRS